MQHETLKTFLVASLILLLFMLAFSLAWGQDAISPTLFLQEEPTHGRLVLEPPRNMAELFARYCEEEPVPPYEEPTPLPGNRDRDLDLGPVVEIPTATPIPTPRPKPKPTPTPTATVIQKDDHPIIIRKATRAEKRAEKDDPLGLNKPTPVEEPSRTNKPLSLTPQH